MMETSGLERDKFDNKTVTFEEHIKVEHNMWHYLFFIVLVKVKDSTEYTGPESYVAEMIRVRLMVMHMYASDISHIHLAKLQSKAFSGDLSFPQPISFLLAVTKAGSDCGELSFNDAAAAAKNGTQDVFALVPSGFSEG